jgi:zinc protease
MQLVSEALREPTFPENEFETLKQQQITSLDSQRREPQAIAFLEAFHHLSPYPEGDPRYVPTIDEQIASVKAATLDDVKTFYREYYGASHAEFAVVGDFDAEAFQKQASTMFADWTTHERYERVPEPFKDVEAMNRSIDTPDKANAMFVAVQPIQMNDTTAGYPALTLANYMLGGGFLNSRLASRIREKEGLSYGIGTQLQVPTKDDMAVFMTYAISAPQNTAKVEAAFIDELNKAKKDGFTDQEVAVAKSGWLQSRQVSRNSDNELVTRLAGLTFWDRTMEWEADFENKVKAVTAAEVNAAVRKYIDPAKITIVKAGDFSKPKPTVATGS